MYKCKSIMSIPLDFLYLVEWNKAGIVTNSTKFSTLSKFSVPKALSFVIITNHNPVVVRHYDFTSAQIHHWFIEITAEFSIIQVFDDKSFGPGLLDTIILHNPHVKFARIVPKHAQNETTFEHSQLQTVWKIASLLVQSSWVGAGDETVIFQSRKNL